MYDKEYQKQYRELNKEKIEQLRIYHYIKRKKEVLQSRFDEIKDIKFYDIEGYEGEFVISKCGKIMNAKTFRLKSIRKDRYGYQIVTLKNKTHILHRLLALTFIPNPDPTNLNEINHLNGIKDDNRLENLEWSNRRLNMLHAHKMGLWKSNLIQWHEKKKKKLESGKL